MAFLIPLSASTTGDIGVMVCRFLQGFTLSPYYIFAAYAMAAKWFPISERSRMISFMLGGISVGGVTSMFLSGFIAASWYGWPMVFYLYNGFGLIWSIIFCFYGRNGPADHLNISPEEKLFIETSLAQESKGNLSTPWLKILLSPCFWALVLAHCAYFWGYLVLLSEIPIYIKHVMKFNIKSEEPKREPPDKPKSKESETLQETCKEARPPTDRPATQESKVKRDQFEDAFRKKNDNENKLKTNEIKPNWSTKNEEKDSESPESPGTPGYMDCQSTPGTPITTQPETLKANFMLGPIKDISIPSEIGKSISSMIPNVETDEIIIPEGVYEAMAEIDREMDRHITEGTYRIIPETFEETQFQIPVGTYETAPGGNIVVEHPPRTVRSRKD
ncbi:hypothetical protein JTB14_022149 [Gonioctena quinquepunctata]|nr:hypothetical protein JTB14_022149 [Gonioctena quinquepunctata]